MSKPLTVGELRAALADRADDVMVMVSPFGIGTSPDLGIESVVPDLLIPWDHDCDEAPEGHQSGRDCPKVDAVTIYAQQAEDFEEAPSD